MNKIYIKIIRMIRNKDFSFEFVKNIREFVILRKDIRRMSEFKMVVPLL